MKAINNYNDTIPYTGERRKLPAGGYVCRIVKVEDYPQDERLVIYYDVLDGPWAKYFEDDYNRWGKENWRGKFSQYYSEDKLGTFKAFIQAVDDSNGSNLNNAVEGGLDERALVKKKFGAVIGYKTWSYNGKTGQTTYVKLKLPVSRIEDGDYDVPELWDCAGIMGKNEDSAFTALETADADLPF